MKGLFLILVVVLSLGRIDQAAAQPYTVSVEREPYVDLTEQDLIISDTDALWRGDESGHLHSRAHMMFPAFGMQWDLFKNETLCLHTSGMVMLHEESKTFWFELSSMTARLYRNEVSEFSYKVTNDSGLVKVLKLQWKNMRLYAGLRDDYMNAQLWLYEDGRIDVRYGGWLSKKYEDDDSIGVKFRIVAIDEGLYEDWSLEGPVFSPSLVEKFPSTVTGIPDSGMVYKFYPVTSSVKEEKRKDVSIYEHSDRLIVRSLTEPATIRLSNILGQTVLVSEIAPQEMINIRHLPAGVYHVACVSNGRVIVSQMILNP